MTIGGLLSDKLNRRKPLIIAAGVINVPIIWMIGRAPTVLHLAIFTGSTWFLAGFEAVLLNILTGLFADPATRGKVFGILTLTEGIIAILSGLTFGRIADVYGFPTLFITLAMLELILPVFALFLRDKSDRMETYHDLQRDSGRKPQLRIGKAFGFLLSAQLFAGISIHVGSLGRSLTMTELGFSAAAITSTVAVGGLASMPLRPILGGLSDRIRREYILAILNTFTVIGLVILSLAESLVQFWIAFAFLYISFIRGPIGAALVTDLVPRESLGRGMALYSVANRIGGIVGFSITGYAIQQFGTSTTFVAAAVLPFIGFILMLAISRIKITKPQ